MRLHKVEVGGMERGGVLEAFGGNVDIVSLCTNNHSEDY